MFLTVTVSPHNEIWRNTITETHSFFRLKKIVYKSIENLSRVWYWKISRKRLQALRKICCYRRFFPDPKRINICYSDISRNFKNIFWEYLSREWVVRSSLQYFESLFPISKTTWYRLGTEIDKFKSRNNKARRRKTGEELEKIDYSCKCKTWKTRLNFSKCENFDIEWQECSSLNWITLFQCMVRILWSYHLKL